MLDKDEVRELATNVEQLLDVHKRQHETMKELLRVCVKHLEDRRRLIPDDTWAERQQLIAALKEVTNEQ